MQRWLVCALCAPRLRFVWALALCHAVDRACSGALPLSGYNCAVCISSRCVRRCTVCLHAGTSMLSDTARSVVSCSARDTRREPPQDIFRLVGASSCRFLRCVVAPVHGTRKGARLAALGVESLVAVDLGRGFVTQVTFIFFFLRICTSSGCDM
eukprot:3385396-Prymnesium_polylepis.1